MRECQCSRTTENYLCDVCDPAMQVLTKKAEWLVLELHTTAARLDKIGTGGNIESKTVSKSAPQAVNYNATLCAGEIQNTLNTLPRRVALKDIHLHPEGPCYYETLKRRYARGIRIIDAKPERFHLGKCPTEDCGEPMNPIKGEREHHCKVCGETTIVEEFKGSKVSAAWNVLCRPPEASRALAAMGLKVPVKSIKNWIQLEKFKPAGESAGHPTYRLSDIYDTAEAMAARKRVKTG